MKVSVVVCTYTEERFADVSECVDALLAQTYDDIQVVLVVDGTESVHERALARYGDEPQVEVHFNDENRGSLRAATAAQSWPVAMSWRSSTTPSLTRIGSKHSSAATKRTGPSPSVGR